MSSTLIIFHLFILLPITSCKSFASAATPNSKQQVNEIITIYNLYKINKTQFYNAKLNKNNFKSQLNLYINHLNNSLSKINTTEAKTSPPIISAEGNQLAFDYELLKPLQRLASRPIDKKSCDEAVIQNSYNAGRDQKSLDLINSVIQKICN